MDRLRIREVVVVEGRYDATAVAGVVDGLIITTEGFSIFTNEEKKALIRRLGAQCGLLILTDSDAAGFRIRHYLQKIAAGCAVRHAYIPALVGKERRKSAPSREGTLGVEGIPAAVLRKALNDAGIAACEEPYEERVSPADLYEWGISGTHGAGERRRALLARLGLPPRLSKTALCRVLGSLYTKSELCAIMAEHAGESSAKPMLFWDFHGTLTLPDINWMRAAEEAAAEAFPNRALPPEVLREHLGGSCLPWFTFADKDTRSVAGPRAWWAYCEGQFRDMFTKCGYSQSDAERLAPMIRERILQPRLYRLYGDAAATLAELQRRGYESHILSNNFPELEQVVAALGLRAYFGRVLSSGNIGYEKPRREIFEAARALAADGRPLWMMGDNPADDIEGAAAAGFVTVAVHGAPSPTATHCVGELSELLALLP